MGRDIMEIATLFIGVAVLALLIGNASKTATVIQSGANAFDELLKTVTLQNSLGAGAGF
jgi:hypothetical protein